MIHINTRAAIVLLGCGTALLSVGCQPAMSVARPPINITDYELACSSTATSYPVYTVLLRNLQRTLDPDLAENARLSSFELVERLGKDMREWRTCLDSLLEGDGVPAELRRRVAHYLLTLRWEELVDTALGSLFESGPFR